MLEAKDHKRLFYLRHLFCSNRFHLPGKKKKKKKKKELECLLGRHDHETVASPRELSTCNMSATDVLNTVHCGRDLHFSSRCMQELRRSVA